MLEGVLAGVRAGEGLMPGSVPVLGENDVLEVRRDVMDDRDDFVAAGHGQCPAGTEIVLNVDDEENVVRGDLHAWCAVLLLLAYDGLTRQGLDMAHSIAFSGRHSEGTHYFFDSGGVRRRKRAALL